MIAVSTEESEWTIAKLRAEIEELQDRVEALEARVARGHNCLVDSCQFDDDGDCLLKPVGEIWGSGPKNAYPWGDDG